DFHVVEVFKTDTAFKALANLGHVILEPSQRSDIAFPTDNAVANQARPRIAPHRAVDHHAAGDDSRAWYAEHFAHSRLAEYAFLLDRLEHADHGRANLFLDLVNDRVETNVDCLLLRDVCRTCFGSHVEADDHDCRRRRSSLRRGTEQHV